MIPGLFPALAQVAPADGSDVAYTPAAVAEACVSFLHQECLMRGSWWEPCAGSGNWLQALGDPQRGLGPGMATELDPQAESVRSGRAVQGDALQGPPGDFEPENIVTNPPFSIAPQLLRSFIQIPSARMVALLLLQQWIVPDGQGAERRRDLCWGPAARPTHQILLYPRIAFEGPGRVVGATDMREYALYLWHRQPDGSWCPPRPTVLRRLNWATGELL